ncbi:MAG: phosphate/phosphite/phosphonate ABC transporter substrate-binding protein [Pseudobdellovibrio sp.]
MLKFFLLALISWPILLWAGTEPITIGLLPGGDPVVIEKESFQLAEKLQQQIGRPVQVYISKNYTGMIEALKNKKVDFAILSSLTYVAAEKQVDLKVLLKKTWNNSPFYYSALISDASGKIKKLKDLKGKTIGFVDEKSTSGYLYPQVELQKNHLNQQDFKNTVFTGNHAASVALLEDGKADAVAVFSDDEKGKYGAWSRFGKNKKFKVKILWVSEPIPNDPIVVRNDFYDTNTKLTHEIMYNLIEIQNDNLLKLGEILGTSDLMPATSRQYDSVREMVKTFQSVIKL